MTLQQVFIGNLKKIRKKRGISQMTLAELCDMGGNYIGQIEMGRRIPSFERIEKIAAVLEIDSYELFLPESGELAEIQPPRAKEYLKKMPGKVKKEIISNLLAALANDIAGSLDPNRY